MQNDRISSAGWPMTTVWVYVDTSKEVGDRDHLKVFATPDAADEWFKENDPEGVAIEYEVSGDETRPRSYCPICGALIDMRALSRQGVRGRCTRGRRRRAKSDEDDKPRHSYLPCHPCLRASRDRTHLVAFIAGNRVLPAKLWLRAKGNDDATASAMDRSRGASVEDVGQEESRLR